MILMIPDASRPRAASCSGVSGMWLPLCIKADFLFRFRLPIGRSARRVRPGIGVAPCDPSGLRACARSQPDPVTRAGRLACFETIREPVCGSGYAPPRSQQNGWWPSPISARRLFDPVNQAQRCSAPRTPCSIVARQGARRVCSPATAAVGWTGRIGRFSRPRLLGSNGDGQALAPLGTPSFQDRTTGACLHALSKAVFAKSFDSTGLVGSFHDVWPPSIRCRFGKMGQVCSGLSCAPATGL